jgi:DNA-directed RNA polymerase specialized sigma subunit
MSNVDKLSFLQKALSSLKDTFDVLLKVDAPKPKEYKEWSPSKEYHQSHSDKISDAMTTHGFNIREAAVHSGAESESPKNTKFTPFSENWLKHAKEHAANKNSEFEAQRFAEAKPEEQPLVSTQHVSQQLSAQHGQNYGAALKDFLSKPEHASLTPEQKKQKVHEFKRDFHVGGKSNLNNDIKQTRNHEANALAALATNKEDIVRNIMTGGAGADSSVPESETRSAIATKKKVSAGNPLSEKDVANYLNHNAGYASHIATKGLRSENRLGQDESMSDHQDLAMQGLWQALHHYKHEKGASFPSFAAEKIKNLVRKRKDAEQGSIPAGLKQQLSSLRQKDSEQLIQDKGAGISADERAKMGIESSAGEEENRSSMSSSLTPDARLARRLDRDKLAEKLQQLSPKTKAAKERAQKIQESMASEVAQRLKHLDSQRANLPGVEKPFETPDHLYDAPAGEGHSFGDLVDYTRDDFDKKRGVNPTGKIDPNRIKDVLSKLEPLDFEEAPDEFVRLVHQHAPEELAQHEGFNRLSPQMQKELRGDK